MALDDRALETFKNQLAKEREEVVSALESLGVSRTVNGGYDPNFADISQVTAEKGEADALATPLRDTLGEIDFALKRISEGSYGVCLKCSSNISLERLEALPMTKYCSKCASLAH